MSFAAVVVTYYPDEAAILNLEILAQWCPQLYVIDNTPRKDERAFPALATAKVTRQGENMGLAAGLNLGIGLAGSEGIENIFLFDQDSRLPEAFFAGMLAFKAAVERRTESCVLYVPNFRDRNTGTLARFPVLTRFSCRLKTCEELRLWRHPFREALIAITSGSLLSYSRYLRVGPFREDYFIGFIDAEYCLRAWKLGFRVALNCEVTIDHAIGNRQVRRFLGFTIKPSFEGPPRRYYSARNGTRTSLDSIGTFPAYFPFILASLGLETLSILLYEDRRLSKIGALFLGMLHGMTGRMGEWRGRES